MPPVWSNQADMFSTEIQAFAASRANTEILKRIAVSCKRPIIYLREAKVKKNERTDAYGDNR
jgi:hypothetical protein